MSEGFLGRWSRRKLDASQGKPLPQEPIADALPADPLPVPTGAAPGSPQRDAPLDEAMPAAGEPEPPPLPTIEDVQALTPESDFSRFVAREVAPDVKNAALKKLFADPHYNVMDGLDVYIDDYSRPDPLPSHVVRQLAGAAFLRLFDEPPATAAPAAGTREVADDPAARSVAQSDTATEAAADLPDHADPDLRLQQDDAAAAGDARQGAA